MEYKDTIQSFTIRVYLTHTGMMGEKFRLSRPDCVTLCAAQRGNYVDDLICMDIGNGKYIHTPFLGYFINVMHDWHLNLKIRPEQRCARVWHPQYVALINDQNIQ